MQPIVSREYGVFQRWPRNGDDWIHPDDVESLRGLIPSDRIFLREWRGGEYAELSYGQLRVRIRPSMWIVVPAPEFSVGAEVEIRSLLGQHDPGTAVVREVYWDAHAKCACYELEQRGLRLPQRFLGSDLKPIEFLG